MTGHAGDDRLTVAITAEMDARWMPQFLGMLKTMERLGRIGASRRVVFYSDGDGDFDPRFTWDSEIEPAEPTITPYPEEDHVFDAG